MIKSILDDAKFLVSPANTESVRRAIDKMVAEHNHLLDERIRCCLKPKPRWLPERVWLWLVGKLFVVEQLQGFAWQPRP
jgi:hypothetical protein